MFKYISAQSADALGPIEYKISTLHLYFVLNTFFPLKVNATDCKNKKKILEEKMLGY